MAIGTIGVGSGLDLESLLVRLITAEGTPRLTSLAGKEARVQANISAFGSLKSTLDRLQTAAAALREGDALQRRATSTGGSTLFGASADSTAAAGQYNVQVFNKATAHKLSSSAGFASGLALVGEGTLTIGVGADSFDIATTASTTLTELKNQINAATDNTGVTASLLVVALDPLDAGAGTVTRLVLTANSTGAANTIEVSVADADLNNTDDQGLSRFYFAAADPLGSQLDQGQAARDARIAVDGFVAFSASNTFADVIDGVTLTALNEPADPLNPPVETLTVSLDLTAAKGRLQSFIDAYNDVVNTLRELTAYNAETKTAAALAGDATVRGIATQLRAIVGASGIGTEAPGSLSEIGVSVQRDGTLKLDGARVDTVLRESLPQVVQLLAGDEGIATQVDDALEGLLGREGALLTRTQGLDRQLASIGTEREEFVERLNKIEAQYRERFAALDALVARLQSSGDFLLAQLENTANIIGRRPGDR